MNQVSDTIRAGAVLESGPDPAPPPTDPIAAAAIAVERCLALAHEAGDVEAVRLLHAVTALLAAAPRH